jgi:hypothetical protein
MHIQQLYILYHVFLYVRTQLTEERRQLRRLTFTLKLFNHDKIVSKQPWFEKMMKKYVINYMKYQNNHMHMMYIYRYLTPVYF